MSSNIGVSFIVSTKNRPFEIERLLNSILMQKYSNYEIIVINQGSNENKKSLDKFINTLKIKNIIHISSCETGLSKARNEGLKISTKEIITFPDDDCWYSKYFLKKVLVWFENNPKYDFLSGIYTEPGIKNQLFKYKSVDLKYWNFFEKCCSVGLLFKSYIFKNTNLYFNERIGVGTNYPSGEEVELVYKILKNGFRGRYEPGIEVYHKIYRNANVELKSIMTREKAAGYVLGSIAFSPNIQIILRLTGGTIINLIRCIFSNKTKNRFYARLEGYRIAIQNRIRF